MKKTKQLLSLLFALLFVLSVCSLTVFAEEETTDPSTFVADGITGTFISPWLYNSFSDARMDKEFKRMKEIGIDTLIMGDCANKDKGENTKWTVNYPSKIEEFGGATCGQDAVKRILDYCKKYDIKLYLGVGCDSDWWDKNLSVDAAGAWLKDVCNISAKMVKELYDLYMPEYSDVFYGYYWVYEIWNHGAWNIDATRDAYVQNLAAGFNIVIDAINQVDPTMPLMFSPFITPNSGLATKENCCKFYTSLFELTNFRSFDAIAPMDNIGGGGMKIDMLDEWTRDTYYQAVLNSKNKLQLWSNCESFVQPANTNSGTWTTCTMDRFVKQVQITSKYCEKIISFSWNHYMSPYNTVSGFDRSFVEYLKTGELEKVAPSAPTRVSTYLSGDYLIAKWNQGEDEYDIAKYEVEKQNSSTKEFTKFSECLIGRYDGQDITLALKSSLSDSGYNKTGQNVYRVRAVDCSGNASEYIYIVIDGANPDNGVDLKANDDNKGCYTQAEFDQLKNSVAEEPEEPADDMTMILIAVLIFVIVLAIAAVAVVLVIVKVRKK